MHAERVKFLISLYCNDTISSSELQELSDLLALPQFDGYFGEMLEAIWDAPLIHHAIPASESTRIIATILPFLNSDIQEQAVVIPIETSQKWYKKIMVAASILLVFSASYFLLKPVSVVKNQLIAANIDVKPGGQKAMLTLSDGSKIALDGLSDGLITQEGGTKIIKLANGQIKYAANQTDSKAIYYNTMSTPPGGQYQLELPDGTKVWLNAASSIRYPNVFSGNERRVNITGEAYFEVIKNGKMPFIVGVDGGAEIKVLGTHFNINSYANESALKATLLEGSIRIEKNKNFSLLKPGNQAQIAENGAIKLVDGVDMDEVVAWKNGNFHFKGADLSTVLRQIARWYDLEIDYKAIPQGENRFTGKIPMKVNLSRLIKWMEWSDVHFRVEGKKLKVLPY